VLALRWSGSQFHLQWSKVNSGNDCGYAVNVPSLDGDQGCCQEHGRCGILHQGLTECSGIIGFSV
jgi:hypothetical protein